MKIRAHSTCSVLADAARSAPSRSSCTPRPHRSGPKVTNATPGQSKHSTTRKGGGAAAEAFDIVPLVVGGKAEWDSKHPHWAKAGTIGEVLGLEWADRWTSKNKFLHFQLKG